MSTTDPSLQSWSLQALIGRGASGHVWAAEKVGEPEAQSAALKIAAAARSITPAQLSQHWPRISNRLRSIAAVHHPGVVRVLEWGALPAEAQLWIAMERLHPDPRANIVDPADPTRQRPACLAAGLAALHARDIIHADIKPSNILSLAGGRSVLIDFALVPLDVAPGAPRWMAPECVEGGPATRAGDVYALGQCLTESYTRKPSFSPQGRGPARLLSLLQQKRASSPLDPGDRLSPTARATLRSATEPKAADRPSAAELAAALSH